jgi:hypothetical protein
MQAFKNLDLYECFRSGSGTELNFLVKERDPDNEEQIWMSGTGSRSLGPDANVRDWIST